MTDSRTTTRSIQATLSESALQKVPTFFDGSLRQTLTELLQNARRAGSTRVDITLDRSEKGQRITLQDDGHGISDPATILDFGGSDWRPDVFESETPAGMGIFSLARRSPSITSVAPGLRWSADLTLAHFTGENPATITTELILDSKTGTRIAFHTLATDSWVPDAISNAVRYYPLLVRFNGEAAEQTDFLAGAEAVVQSAGVRIGVFRKPLHCYDAGQMNFHGHVINHDLPSVSTLPRSETDGGHRWWILIDVLDAPGLELTLPARNDIVQNEYLSELKNQATRAMFQTIREQGARLSHRDRRRAIASKVRLPKEKPMLEPWVPKCLTGTPETTLPTTIPPGALLVSQQLSEETQQNLWRALLEGEESHRVFQTSSDLEGYPWYDQIPVVTRIDAVVTETDGSTSSHTSTPRAQWAQNDGASRAVQSIELKIAAAKDGAETTIYLPTDILLLTESRTSDDPQQVRSITALITPDRAPGRCPDGPLPHDRVRDAAEMIASAYFRPTYSENSAGHASQRAAYSRQAKVAIRKLIECPEDVEREDVEDLLKTVLLPSLGPNVNLDIRIREGRIASIADPATAAA